MCYLQDWTLDANTLCFSNVPSSITIEVCTKPGSSAVLPGSSAVLVCMLLVIAIVLLLQELEQCIEPFGTVTNIKVVKLERAVGEGKEGCVAYVRYVDPSSAIMEPSTGAPNIINVPPSLL